MVSFKNIKKKVKDFFTGKPKPKSPPPKPTFKPPFQKPDRTLPSAKFGPKGPEATLGAIDRAKQSARPGKSLPFPSQGSAPSRTENRREPAPIVTTSNPDTVPVNFGAVGDSVKNFGSNLANRVGGVLNSEIAQVAQTIPGLGMVGGPAGAISAAEKATLATMKNAPGWFSGSQAAWKSMPLAKRISAMAKQFMPGRDAKVLMEIEKVTKKLEQAGMEVFKGTYKSPQTEKAAAGYLGETQAYTNFRELMKVAENTATNTKKLSYLTQVVQRLKSPYAVAGYIITAGTVSLSYGVYSFGMTRNERNDAGHILNTALGDAKFLQNEAEVLRLTELIYEFHEAATQMSLIDEFNYPKAALEKANALKESADSALRNMEFRKQKEAEALLNPEPTYADEREEADMESRFRKEAFAEEDRKRELAEREEDNQAFDKRQQEYDDRKARMAKDEENKRKKRREEELRQRDEDAKFWEAYNEQKNKKGGEIDYEKFKKSQLGFGLIR